MKNRYLSWLPAILIMVIIFRFSSEPADASGENSLRIADTVMKIYERITDRYVEEELRDQQLHVLEYYVRKTAHVTEYAILAAAFGLPLWLRRQKRRLVWLWSVMLAAGYAATDELHQIFVPGRSGELRDVMIDSIGAMVGAYLFILIANIILRHKKKETGFTPE